VTTVEIGVEIVATSDAANHRRGIEGETIVGMKGIAVTVDADDHDPAVEAEGRMKQQWHWP
jgi:hypothetical protein